ncbi:MAG: hypothetical protein U1F25_20485 [Rubrivivax sp.]
MSAVTAQDIKRVPSSARRRRRRSSDIGRPHSCCWCAPVLYIGGTKGRPRRGREGHGPA